MKYLGVLLLIFGCVSQEPVKVESGPGSLSVTSSLALNGFNAKPLNSTTTATLVFRNLQGLPLVGLEFSNFSEESPFQYVTGFAPGDAGACQQGQSLVAGASCSLQVEFKPRVEGSWPEALTITFNDGVTFRVRSFELFGSAGRVANLTTAQDFEPLFLVTEVGSSRDLIVELTNSGGLSATALTQTLLGDGDMAFKGGSYPGVGGSCGTSVPAGATCRLVITFAPLSNRAHSKTLTLSYETGLGPGQTLVTFAATSATIQAELLLIGGALGAVNDYKKVVVGVQKNHVFTVINAGYLAAETIAFQVPAPFSIVSHTCPSVLPVAGVCQVTVAFTPLLKAPFAGTLEANYFNGKTSALTTASVLGEGLLPATLAFSDGPVITSFDFGAVAVNGEKKKLLRVTNVGDVEATAVSLPPLASPFAVNSLCPSTLVAGQNCLFEVSAAPLAPGALAVTPLRIDFHSGVALSQASLPLSGTGDALGFLRFSETPAEYDFGPVFIGSMSAAKLVELRNVGLAPATDVTATLSSTEFRYTGGAFPGLNGDCPTGASFTLAALASCRLEVEFSPLAPAFAFQTLSVGFHDGAESIPPINYTLLGMGRAAAQLTFSVASPWDAGLFARTVSHFLTVDVTNTGSVEATSISGNLSSGTDWQFTGAGTFPGVEPPLSAIPACAASLGAGSQCRIFLRFQPSTLGVKADTLTLSFESGNGAQASVLNFSGESLNLGFLSMSEEVTIPSAVVGGSFQETNLTIQNTGQASVTGFSYAALSGGFSVNAGASTCGTTIAAGATCLLRLRYTPAMPLGTKSTILDLSYHDGALARSRSVTVNSEALQAALLTINQGPLYDYGIIVVNTTLDRTFTVTNTRSGPASSVSLSGLAAPFSVLSTTCGSVIPGFGTCDVSVRFAPTVVGVEHTDTLEVNYHNQVSALQATRNLKGTGEAPPSTHGGWSEVFAVGNRVDTSNTSSGDKMIRLRWNTMTPTSGVITGYNVYRSLDPLTFDLNAPVATNIATSSRTFTDTATSNGTAYYYMVRPIILGFPSRILNPAAEVIRVVAPPDNMALVHRTMANLDACQKLGRSVDILNHNRCASSGIGNLAGFLDLGYDLLVDRYELGADLTSRAGQLPRASLSQNGAKLACELQSGLSLVGVGTVSKRILSRREWMLSASWPSSLSDSAIAAVEQGAFAGTDCNGNSSTLEMTGNNPTCRSRYGTEDHAGNAWEWVSDRVFNGVGVTLDTQRLILSNRDLDGVDLTTLSNQFVENQPCLSRTTGFVLPFVSGTTCPADTVDLSGQPVIFSRGDYAWAPSTSGGRLAVVGGSFLSTSYSGLYTTFWAESSFSGASVRCGIQLSN